MRLLRHLIPAALLIGAAALATSCAGDSGQVSSTPNTARLARAPMEATQQAPIPITGEALPAREDTLRRQYRETVRVLENNVLASLSAFRAEPSRSCRSPNLVQAATSAVSLAKATLLREEQGAADAEKHHNAAQLMLSVADAAAERGCTEVAEAAYRYVIAAYHSLGSTTYRQHAEIGLASLRGTPTVRDEPRASAPSLLSQPPPTQPGPLCAENGSCYGDISKLTGRPKTAHVQGYYRKDGTYVRGHYRSKPRRR